MANAAPVLITASRMAIAAGRGFIAIPARRRLKIPLLPMLPISPIVTLPLSAVMPRDLSQIRRKRIHVLDRRIPTAHEPGVVLAYVRVELPPALVHALNYLIRQPGEHRIGLDRMRDLHVWQRATGRVRALRHRGQWTSDRSFRPPQAAAGPLCH